MEGTGPSSVLCLVQCVDADHSAEVVTAPKVKIVACKSGEAAAEGKKGKAE